MPPSCSRAACWQPRPQTRRASGGRNPLTLGVVLGIKPLPAALVVAQQRHGSGGHAASFTPTKTPSISSLPAILPLFPRGSQHRRREVTLPAFGGSWRRRLVTGELAKDGHGSWRDPRYLQRHISVLPHAPAHAGARRRGRGAAGCPGVGRGLPAPASRGICSTMVLVLGSVEPQLLSSCWESSRFIYHPEKGLKVCCKGKEETSQGPRAKCAHGTRGPEQGMCPDIPDPHQGLVQPRDEICPRQLSLLPPSPQKCAN